MLTKKSKKLGGRFLSTILLYCIKGEEGKVLGGGGAKDGKKTVKKIAQDGETGASPRRGVL